MRPTKLTPEVQGRIVQAIRAGNYMETAAAYAGLNKSTVYRWMKRGERGEAPFVQFCDALKKALAASEMRDLAVISTAAEQGEWQAAAWRLERKFPERWGRRRPRAARGFVLGGADAPDRGKV